MAAVTAAMEPKAWSDVTAPDKNDFTAPSKSESGLCVATMLSEHLHKDGTNDKTTRSDETVLNVSNVIW